MDDHFSFCNICPVFGGFSPPFVFVHSKFVQTSRHLSCVILFSLFLSFLHLCLFFRLFAKLLLRDKISEYLYCYLMNYRSVGYEYIFKTLFPDVACLCVYRWLRRTQRWAWTAWSWRGPAIWSSRASSRPYTASAARSSSPPSSSRWSSRLTTFAHPLICNQWITSPHVSDASRIFQLCGIVLSKAGTNVYARCSFCLAALCVARLAPISCALQFCVAAFVLSKALAPISCTLQFLLCAIQSAFTVKNV